MDSLNDSFAAGSRQHPANSEHDARASRPKTPFAPRRTRGCCILISFADELKTDNCRALRLRAAAPSHSIPCASFDKPPEIRLSIAAVLQLNTAVTLDFGARGISAQLIRQALRWPDSKLAITSPAHSA